MAREDVAKKLTIPAKTTTVYEEVIICDKCGKQIYVDPEDEELYAQELQIYLNLDLCVNSRVKLDLCLACLDPIWVKICEAIGADPEDELRIGQE